MLRITNRNKNVYKKLHNIEIDYKYNPTLLPTSLYTISLFKKNYFILFLNYQMFDYFLQKYS